MVAYSFKARFAQPILDGVKRQTIRADRKRHARRGEELQLYQGMRTRHCRLIMRAKCVETAGIWLVFSRTLGPVQCSIGGIDLDTQAIEDFARADGFGRDGGLAAFDMTKFWFEEHAKHKDDVLEFKGVVIRWSDLNG